MDRWTEGYLWDFYCWLRAVQFYAYDYLTAEWLVVATLEFLLNEELRYRWGLEGRSSLYAKDCSQHSSSERSLLLVNSWWFLICFWNIPLEIYFSDQALSTKVDHWPFLQRKLFCGERDILRVGVIDEALLKIDPCLLARFGGGYLVAWKSLVLIIVHFAYIDGSPAFYGKRCTKEMYYNRSFLAYRKKGFCNLSEVYFNFFQGNIGSLRSTIFLLRSIFPSCQVCVAIRLFNKLWGSSLLEIWKVCFINFSSFFSLLHGEWSCHVHSVVSVSRYIYV